MLRDAVGDEVMAAVDEADGERRLYIADVSRDDAWVSAASGRALELTAWR